MFIVRGKIFIFGSKINNKQIASSLPKINNTNKTTSSYNKLFIFIDNEKLTFTRFLLCCAPL
jgi:hypothetical protein